MKTAAKCIFIGMMSGLFLAAAGLAPAASTPVPEAFDMQRLLDEQVKSGAKTIVIPPGRYRVEPANRQHLVLAGLRGIEIVAEGVELLCTENTRALTIQDCRDIVVRGLTIDYDPLPFTQGKIAALSPDKQTHDIELFEGYPPADAGIDAKKYEIFRPDTRDLRFGSYHGCSVEVLSPSRIRVTKPAHLASSEFKPEQVGDIIAIGRQHAPRGSLPHAVYCQGSANVRLEDITVYSAAVFGFMEHGCEATTYLRCRIDRRPPEDDYVQRADPRIRSLNADAFHSTAATIGPRYIECRARFMGDDCINIHGDYHLVTSSGGGALRALAKREMDIAPGDTVEIVAWSGERLPDARVESVQPDGAISDEEKRWLAGQAMNPDMKSGRGMLSTAWRITLDSPVALERGALIASTRRMGNGFFVQGCVFGPNRSRGILVKASDGRIVDNTLEGTWSEAIKVAGERYWLESGSSSNLVIEGNEIRGGRSAGHRDPQQPHSGLPRPGADRDFDARIGVGEQRNRNGRFGRIAALGAKGADRLARGAARNADQQ